MHYDAGLFFSRHFIENALYAAWASDSLCIDVGQLSGLSLTGEFTSSFFGEEMNELIGAQSVELTLRPLSPFTVLFSDDQPPFSLIMDDFALEGFGPVLHRRSRLLQVNLDSEIGIWMNLEGNSLYPELPLTQEDFFVQEAYSEILSAGYSEGVPSLIELALSSVLPEDAMPILHLPVVLGLELDTIIWDHDQDQDWLGAFVLFNTDEIEAMPISGCSASDLGCDSGGPQVDIDVDELLGCNDVQVGCEGGCAHQKGLRLPFGRIFGGLMICCMAIVRRRD
jgi:hypothetical protein